jgi:hypothetical protein
LKLTVLCAAISACPQACCKWCAQASPATTHGVCAPRLSSRSWMVPLHRCLRLCHDGRRGPALRCSSALQTTLSGIYPMAGVCTVSCVTALRRCALQYTHAHTMIAPPQDCRLAGATQLVPAPRHGCDEHLARKLWDLSEKLCAGKSDLSAA